LDGTFEAKPTVSVFNEKKEFSYQGTWEVKDGFYLTKVTKSNFPLAEVGRISHHKVLYIDKQKLIYKSENGGIYTCNAAN